MVEPRERATATKGRRQRLRRHDAATTTTTTWRAGGVGVATTTRRGRSGDDDTIQQRRRRRGDAPGERQRRPTRDTQRRRRCDNDDGDDDCGDNGRRRLVRRLTEKRGNDGCGDDGAAPGRRRRGGDDDLDDDGGTPAPKGGDDDWNDDDVHRDAPKTGAATTKVHRGEPKSDATARCKAQWVVGGGWLGAPRRPALTAWNFESTDQMTRMTERMFEGFTHNHEVMVLGRRPLDVLMSRSLDDELALYRGRLQRFQEALHIRFVDKCICWLIDDSKGPVLNHELRALRITAARRSPCRGREFAMEQALLDEMTSEPLQLAREDLGNHVFFPEKDRLVREGFESTAALRWLPAWEDGPGASECRV
ncbi:hypothetical protein AK812_SmicGene34571 [Symbiodinium microadriaticum]|uniref:Uncharacterized protein n=1 Tax=Symbiodinium microadriaticum TaxID=2951 RepID=A0A1Q9CNR2_SYMMI|nr:hypothetical protein AK812_SmicGene34571 [Symbiodinium microadriaticum]